MSKKTAHVIRGQFDPYNPDDYGFETIGESMTVQSEAAACDINNIMARYEKAQISPFAFPSADLCFDATAITDYKSALDAIQRADQLFMLQPAHIRSRFQNDAGKFVQFIDDPENLPQLIELGLAYEVDPVTGQRLDPTASKEPGRGEAARAREGASEGSSKARKGRAGAGQGDSPSGAEGEA